MKKPEEAHTKAESAGADLDISKRFQPDGSPRTSDEAPVVPTEVLTTTVQFSYIQYGLFYLLGVVYLSAWNVFISCPEYMESRLKGSPFQNNFQNYFSTVFMGFELISLTWLTLFAKNFSLMKRVNIGFLLLTVVFVCTFVLSIVPKPVPTVFFRMILALIAVAGIATSLLASLYGIVAKYNPMYMQALNAGQGLAGLVPCMINIITKMSSGKTEGQEQGSAYFIVPIGITVFGYLCFWKALQKKEPVTTDSSFESSSDIPVTDETNQPSNTSVFKQIWPLFTGVGFVFLVTLALFPSITTNIKSVEKEGTMSLYLIDIHFLSTSFLGQRVDLIHLVFNLSDFIGKSIPGIKFLYMKSTKLSLSVTYARIVYAVLFFLCNVVILAPGGGIQPRTFPLVFGDAMYLVILFTFGLTSGWFSTNILMQAPSLVPENMYERVGQIMVYGLTIGLAMGSALSFVVRSIFCQCNPFA